MNTFEEIIEPLYTDNKQETANGFIQYKGTDLCMDLNCICGEQSHVDGDFVSLLQCPHCDRIYLMPIFIKPILLTKGQVEIAEKSLPSIKIADK